MKTITAAAAALAVLAMAARSSAQTTGPDNRPPTLTVSGTGTLERAPDRAFISVTIVTNDDVAGRATSANNSAYNALIAKLAALGVSGAAVKTTGYNVSFNQRPPQPNQQFPQRYGYVVTRNVTVTSDRTDQVGALIDAATSAGVTDVGSVSFGLRDGRAAYRAALAAAMTDADAQAHALADAAHVRLLRIATVSAGSSLPVPRPVPYQRMASAAAAPPVPTEVPPSDLTVNASVGVTYEIAP
jgi:uncharacterized protein YggE